MDELDASLPYAKLNPNVLLTQAGYLTIREVSITGTITLGYPNNEVASSLARLVTHEMMAGKTYSPAESVFLSDVLAHRGLDNIVARFNAVLQQLDYQRYPITDEASCRSHLQMLIIGAEMVPSVEVHSELGRSDLEVDAGDRHWVFELKFAGENEDSEKKLAQGIEQVKKNRYGEGLHGGKLLRAVLVFSGSERRFVAWKAVDGDACA